MIENIVNAQREYFLTGVTKGVNFRKAVLKKLKEELINNEALLCEAFMQDFNKCEFDVIATEFSMVIAEIDHMLKHLSKYAKDQKVRSNFINFPSHGFIHKEPYGVVLVMAPWNYPLQLSFSPLVGAIAAGNTVVLKPSEYAYNVARAMGKVLSHFDDKLISVVLGGREVNQTLLDQKFDYIFFTGGDVVGRIVMEKAAKHLTPFSLELGGKSPCIVDETADLDLAAKRITWGKYLNAGQTCVAPDYLLVHASVKEELIKKIKQWIKKFYYVDGKLSPSFTYIINDKHVERLKGLINKDKLIFGGNVNNRQMEPTILDGVTREDAVMQEEIFGPILPVLTFEYLIDVVKELQTLDKPLALYYFSNNNNNIEYVVNSVSYGGGCINDTIMHLTNDMLPFGGVGRSGMGAYHGEKSFETFSHYKSVFVKGKVELDVKYPPYDAKKLATLRKVTK